MNTLNISNSRSLKEVCECGMFDSDAAFFSASRFVQRGACGAWDASMQYLYATSGVLILLCYYAISGLLVHTLWEVGNVRKEAELDGSVLDLRNKYGRMTRQDFVIVIITYAAFIMFCGTGHAEQWIAFRWPAYHVFAVWHGLTALVSIAAVAVTQTMRFKLLAWTLGAK